jgi:rhodanese-related sulfurtransferase
MLSFQTLSRCIALILLAFGLGMANMALNPNSPGFIGHYPVISAADTAIIPEAAEPDDPPYLSIGEAADLFNTPGVIFVDARDSWDYEQGYIKGAVNVPFEGDEQIYMDFVAATPKDQVMVVYCAGAECDLSLYLGRNLKYDGFTNVNIFFGGWSDWRLKELPADMPTSTESPETGESSEAEGGE